MWACYITSLKLKRMSAAKEPPKHLFGSAWRENGKKYDK
ncbi:hypothetical protein (plasmid) [Citrobacter freundii]|nr:hypothetical protein [Citrobacter freundii]